MLTFTQFGVIRFTQYCVIAFYTVLCNLPAVAFDHNSHKYMIFWLLSFGFDLICELARNFCLEVDSNVFDVNDSSLVLSIYPIICIEHF